MCFIGTALISQRKNSLYGQITLGDRFAKQHFSFQGPINLRVLWRVINVAIMLFLITGKTITALTGSDSIIMFDYRQALCDARGLFVAFYQSWIPLGSTGDQEHSMPHSIHSLLSCLSQSFVTKAKHLIAGAGIVGCAKPFMELLIKPLCNYIK